MQEVESINASLENLFGIDTITGKPIFRVVWSDDQFENRKTKYTDDGIELLHAEVRYLPKYKQYIQSKYILERLVLVPDVNAAELPTQRQSYEPLWVFQTDKGDALAPNLEVCKFVIDTLYAAIGKRPLEKIAEAKNPDDANAPIRSKMEHYEHNKAKIDKLQNEMFGNESALGGQTVNESGDTIIVPGYSKEIH